MENKKKVGAKTKYTAATPSELRIYADTTIMNGELPTLAEFALHKGVTQRTLENWATAHTEMDEAIETFKGMCATFVARGALGRKFDPTFAKFLLKACYGVKETEEVRLGAVDGKDFEIKLTVAGENDEA